MSDSMLLHWLSVDAFGDAGDSKQNTGDYLISAGSSCYCFCDSEPALSCRNLYFGYPLEESAQHTAVDWCPG